MPERIQRKRTKGSKMPQGAIYVGRPSVWGNPFIVGIDGTAEECVRKFEKWFDPTIAEEGSDLYNFRMENGWGGNSYAILSTTALRGKDLACWCAVDAQWCHADIILRIANEGV